MSFERRFGAFGGNSDVEFMLPRSAEKSGAKQSTPAWAGATLSRLRTFHLTYMGKTSIFYSPNVASVAPVRQTRNLIFHKLTRAF